MHDMPIATRDLHALRILCFSPIMTCLLCSEGVAVPSSAKTMNVHAIRRSSGSPWTGSDQMTLTMLPYLTR